MRTSAGFALTLAALVSWSPTLHGADGDAAASPLKRFQEAWYLENGLRNLPEAIKAYEEVAVSAERKGDRALGAKVYMRIGFCYERLQKTKEANQAYGDALRLRDVDDQDFGKVLARLEREAHKRFDIEELPEEIQRSICDHFYTEAENIQGESPEKAIAVYRRAVEVSRLLKQTERAGFAMSFIGDLYRRQERFEDALKTYEEVRKQFPAEAAVLAWNYIRIAEVYRLLGRPAKAVEAYTALDGEKFEKQMQPRLWARLWQGDAHRAMGDLEQARKVWAGLRSDEAEAPIPARLAAMLLDEGEVPAAQEPEDPFANDVAYFVAIRYTLSGDRATAEQWFKKCVELSHGYDWPRQLAENARPADREARSPESDLRD